MSSFVISRFIWAWSGKKNLSDNLHYTVNSMKHITSWKPVHLVKLLIVFYGNLNFSTIFKYIKFAVPKQIILKPLAVFTINFNFILKSVNGPPTKNDEPQSERKVMQKWCGTRWQAADHIIPFIFTKTRNSKTQFYFLQLYISGRSHSSLSSL
jgi:hypothetical protein